MDERNIAVLNVWVIRGVLFMSHLTKKVLDKPPKNRIEVATSLVIARFLVSPFRRIRVVFRGNRGKDRIAVIILGEYIFFLLLLVLCQINKLN